MNEIWADYVDIMADAAGAADCLATKLEAFVRRGASLGAPGGVDAFHAACLAAGRYRRAVDAAAPWHFGTIPTFTEGHVVNLGADELRAFARELRGGIIYAVQRDQDDPRRAVSAPVSTDNGIAGFFRAEVRAMAAFGTPRRTPEAA